jgi:CspA family cold shock protein
LHEGIQIDAVVVWFDAARGFGFVAPVDGSPKAFLHISVLNRAGLHDIAEGTGIVCRVVPSGRGPQVSDLVEVRGVAQREHPPARPEAEVSGTVKWFKADKGFGFVVAEDGGKDVFIHKSVLRRCNVTLLIPGQRVLMHVQETEKGREATWVILL